MYSLPEMETTTVDLMRHGEPVGGRRYRGHLDDPLSDKGWRQMRTAVGDHHPWDTIVSSPLCRCADFGVELAQRHGLPLQIEPRLKEIGFGAWEGRTADELQAEDPLCLWRFYDDPINNTPPGAEPLTAFRDRIVAAWDDLLAQHAGRHLLLIGHAGMMRMILRHVLEMPLDNMFRIHVSNACISRIQVDGRGGEAQARLLFHDGRL